MNLPGRLWPQGFTSRVVLVLVIAISAQFFASGLLFGQDEVELQREDLGKRIAEQLIVAERLIESAPADQREALASALSTEHLEFRLIGSPPVASAHEGAGVLAEFKADILAWEPSLERDELLVALEERSRLRLDSHLIGSIEVGDDAWLGFRTREPVTDWRWATLTLIRVGFAGLVILASAALLVRTLNRPLVQLAGSAALIGTGQRVRFDDQSGPQELRRVSQALNAMQDRIDDVLEQRTRALAAVGHDMRTPLARMHLRIARIPDPSERAAAERDLETMRRMLQELLDYFDNDDIAPPIRTDLSSLCQTICEGWEDFGEAVRFEGPGRLIAVVHHDVLRRAIENLVDNAIRHADFRKILLEANSMHIRISVLDNGPGIPESECDRLVQPFERMDRARGDSGGGIGLGLSITARVAELHGGRLLLHNRPRGGLAAVIELPRQQPEAAGNTLIHSVAGEETIVP